MIGFERSAVDVGGPYEAWNAPGERSWWAVLDRAGKNVLRAADGSGRVFTDERTARALAVAWNA